MPMLAPVDNPLDFASDVAPDDAAPDPELDVLVVPDCVDERVAPADPDVVVAETNRLESDAWSCTWIGCAHMVIGPETCVLSPVTWRTVTMVELVFGSMLVHPAYVLPPFVSMVK
jgi:hypothetical protein